MLKRTAVFLSAFIIACGCASTTAAVTWTSTPSFKDPTTPGRSVVVISDLHLGLGKKANNEWYATEDFRWHKALTAFLKEISKTGNQKVDLIIAGDFLDMWQPPENIHCKGVSADLGCTVDEMKTIAARITAAHLQDFQSFRSFSQEGENRLHIIPGNHDSALLIAAVWEPVGKALGVESGRVDFVSSGVWKSADGYIVIEHGHQIGTEANRYDTWPNIVRSVGGKEYIIRPWGEQFVQKIFNSQEEKYPIIDNLSPESAGIRYRMADRGTWGTSQDVAQFVAFNLFQTSLSQKVHILGAGVGGSPEGKPKWDIARARDQGHLLFVGALPQNDDLRKAIVGDSEQAQKARLALDALAKDQKRLPDENIKQLCEEAEIRGNSVCKTTELGAAAEKLLIPRGWVLATHLSNREMEYPKMRFFIYGHTHLYEETWQPESGFGLSTKVLNSGAFHRVIDEEGYLRRTAAKNISPEAGLKEIKVEQLPPCYTYILVSPGTEPKVWRWVMDESDANGKAVRPGSASCE